MKKITILLIILLTINLSLISANEFLSISLHYTEDKDLQIISINKETLDYEIKNYYGNYKYELVKNNQVLETGYFDNYNKNYYDTVDFETGEITGGWQEEIPDSYFKVLIPYKEADELIISNKESREILVKQNISEKKETPKHKSPYPLLITIITLIIIILFFIILKRKKKLFVILFIFLLMGSILGAGIVEDDEESQGFLHSLLKPFGIFMQFFAGETKTGYDTEIPPLTPTEPIEKDNEIGCGEGLGYGEECEIGQCQKCLKCVDTEVESKKINNNLYIVRANKNSWFEATIEITAPEDGNIALYFFGDDTNKHHIEFGEPKFPDALEINKGKTKNVKIKGYVTENENLIGKKLATTDFFGKEPFLNLRLRIKEGKGTCIIDNFQNADHITIDNKKLTCVNGRCKEIDGGENFKTYTGIELVFEELEDRKNELTELFYEYYEKLTPVYQKVLKGKDLTISSGKYDFNLELGHTAIAYSSGITFTYKLFEENYHHTPYSTFRHELTHQLEIYYAEQWKLFKKEPDWNKIKSEWYDIMGENFYRNEELAKNNEAKNRHEYTQYPDYKGPLYSIPSPYSIFSRSEHLAELVAYGTDKPKHFKDVMNPKNKNNTDLKKKYNSLYEKEFDWACKYGFISLEEYNEVRKHAELPLLKTCK